MRLGILIMTFPALLTGCASAPQPDAGYGSFVRAAPPAHETQIADDVVRQLTVLYPPASTHLSLVHPAQDSFGRQLTEKLRSQGYAVQEATPRTPSITKEAPADSNQVNAGAPFSYVLDSISSPRLYRITLNIARQTISRAYIPQDDLVHPAGAWVRKE